MNTDFGMNNNNIDIQNNNAFAGNIGSSCRLFIFTPINHGAQVIRPYVYKFDQGLVDVMMQGNTVADSFRSLSGFSDPSIAATIIPSANGTLLDTYSLDTMYTFILVIDVADPIRSMVSFGGGKTRTVLTGYFVDEPVNQSTMWNTTPTLNPDALMIFTRNDSVVLGAGNTYGSNPSSNISLHVSNDIIPQGVDSIVSDTNLTLCDVASITNSHTPDGYSKSAIQNGKPMQLSAFNGMSPTIGDRVKTPKFQLINIAQGLDQARDTVSGEQTIRGGLMGGSMVGTNSYDSFMTNLYENLQRPDASMIQQGINPSEPLSLSMLSTLYPALEVVPCEIPHNPQYDIRDQRATNPQTVFSSLVSHNVSALSTTNLISSITFRYSSWINQGLHANKGAWEIINASMITGNEYSENLVEQSVNRFTLDMESSLFPILLNVGGEFDLLVNHSSTGSTSVDLYFKDCYTEDHGFYVDHNLMGGMKSPALGSMDDAINNKAQFDRLSTELASNGFIQ